ncbi:VWA domain-containing protein [Pseudobacteroides cellulosolvens]|nr:VWA domain-containing protein [Pseudobacteroides cellulosolvens]
MVLKEVLMLDKNQMRNARWRLVLGEGSESAFGGCLSDIDEKRDKALGYLYSREYNARNVRGGSRQGSLGDSQIIVPEWINDVHDLFPQKTIERLERDALERYEIQELVTNPELLQRATPSVTLLKAVLHTKHLMNQNVLGMARQLVRKVVDELMQKLARQVESPLFGIRDRQHRSYRKIARNFDVKATIRRNLRHFDTSRGLLVIQDPIFNSRIRVNADRWQVIILVDESGSMVNSVIHSAIVASIFWGIKALKTHLVLFDTNIVDVTADCVDPVEMLMKVQLGGGTDIGKALAYGQSLIDNPRKAIVILITDFYEGADPKRLLGTTHGIVESGAKLLGLAALDEQANPNYDKAIAQRMVNLGAEVAAMTPGELAAWVGEKIR